jgi:hypothetical protein
MKAVENRLIMISKTNDLIVKIFILVNIDDNWFNLQKWQSLNWLARTSGLIIY